MDNDMLTEEEARKYAEMWSNRFGTCTDFRFLKYLGVPGHSDLGVAEFCAWSSRTGPSTYLLIIGKKSEYEYEKGPDHPTLLSPGSRKLVAKYGDSVYFGRYGPKAKATMERVIVTEEDDKKIVKVYFTDAGMPSSAKWNKHLISQGDAEHQFIFSCLLPLAKPSFFHEILGLSNAT